MMVYKKKRRGLPLLFPLLLLLFGVLCASSSAMEISHIPNAQGTRDTGTYPSVSIMTSSGRLDAYLISDTSMIPLRAFYDAYLPDSTVLFDAKTRTATVSAPSLTVSATDASHILYANGRCLYSDTPIIILDDGRMYAPIRSLAKTLSLDVKWDGDARCVYLSGKARALEDGSTYYDADAVYWLSRIISAESRGEPFIGQVAVGNVVLNRVRHKDYPNTIYGVIFDRKYGVQFSPVLNGSIWQAPYAASVTAAKVCLEGYTVSENILYFIDPAVATNFWIPNNRPHVFTIKNHSFYR